MAIPFWTLLQTAKVGTRPTFSPEIREKKKKILCKRMIAKTSTLFALSALLAASMPLASAQWGGPSYNATAQVWPTEVK